MTAPKGEDSRAGTDAGSVPATVGRTGEVALSRRDRVLQQFADMITMIPAPEEDGGFGILERIFAATTVEELDAPWSDSDNEKLIGKRLRIDGITRHESDFSEGLGYFLVMESYNMDDTREVTWSSGSIAVVGQLVQAYCMGWFPVFCTLVKSERATKRGYHPQHLMIERAE